MLFIVLSKRNHILLNNHTRLLVMLFIVLSKPNNNIIFIIAKFASYVIYSIKQT